MLFGPTMGLQLETRIVAQNIARSGEGRTWVKDQYSIYARDSLAKRPFLSNRRRCSILKVMDGKVLLLLTLGGSSSPTFLGFLGSLGSLGYLSFGRVRGLNSIPYRSPQIVSTVRTVMAQCHDIPRVHCHVPACRFRGTHALALGTVAQVRLRPN
ncbi:hypothetical protein B0H65DRAFT_188202 [Neurospora tetraspora]|uniref:Uncharacterized protein n=1 Tax=Neurospora tetraspora TaxID=94610 RepID=A0AAE0JF72_9PEZI|nr:hypothetical protein B0H65DRAFT_188202 [Neurospora tetraspora]